MDEKLPPECDELCPYRSCFCPGFDKGSFTPGRGYTSYHKVPLPCCMTRLTQGCPSDETSKDFRRPFPDKPLEIFNSFAKEVDDSKASEKTKRAWKQQLEIIKMMFEYFLITGGE